MAELEFEVINYIRLEAPAGYAYVVDGEQVRTITVTEEELAEMENNGTLEIVRTGNIPQGDENALTFEEGGMPMSDATDLRKLVAPEGYELADDQIQGPVIWCIPEVVENFHLVEIVSEEENTPPPTEE